MAGIFTRHKLGKGARIDESSMQLIVCVTLANQWRDLCGKHYFLDLVIFSDQIEVRLIVSRGIFVQLKVGQKWHKVLGVTKSVGERIEK